MNGWPSVLKTAFRASNNSFEKVMKSGPRNSIAGRCIALSTRFGMLVGPGVCRKFQPRCTDIGVPLFVHFLDRLSDSFAESPRAQRAADILGLRFRLPERAINRAFHMLSCSRQLTITLATRNPVEKHLR